MSSTEDIRKAIKGLSNQTGMMNILCKVESVDLVNKTCYCQPVFGGADIQDVRLIADNQEGFLIIPAINSLVIVSMLNQAVGYVSMFSNVQEIQLNGDNYGGLVRIRELETQLNTLQTEINTLKTLVGTAIAVYSAAIDGGASASTFNAAQLPQINLTQLENITVKHGN